MPLVSSSPRTTSASLSCSASNTFTSRSLGFGFSGMAPPSISTAPAQVLSSDDTPECSTGAVVRGQFVSDLSAHLDFARRLYAPLAPLSFPGRSPGRASADHRLLQ